MEKKKKVERMRRQEMVSEISESLLSPARVPAQPTERQLVVLGDCWSPMTSIDVSYRISRTQQTLDMENRMEDII